MVKKNFRLKLNAEIQTYANIQLNIKMKHSLFAFF